MSDTLVINQNFLSLTEALQSFHEDVEDLVARYAQNPSSFYDQARGLFTEKMEQWSLLLDKAKHFLVALPKEIKNRDLVRSVLKETERYEIAFKEKSNSFKQAQKNKAEAAWQFLKELQSNSQAIGQRFLALQKNQLMQKLIEGKKILSSRKNLQWGRKVFHTLNGLFGLWLYAFSGMSEWGVIGVLASFLTFSIVVEVSRKKYPPFNEWLCCHVSGLMREHERTKITSATWYMASVLVVFLIFPKDVGILTLLFVALGDTAAGVVGTRWGRTKITEHVSLEGWIAGFFTCALSTLLFTAFWLPHFHLTGFSLFLFSLIAGLIGSTAESVFKKFDDNLTIPLLSAPCIWLLMKLF